MKRSLQTSMTIGIVGFSMALLIGLIFLEGFFMHKIARFYLSTRLEHDSETLIGALVQDPETGRFELEDARIHPIYKQPFSGHYYKMQVADQRFRSRSLWDENLQVDFGQTDFPSSMTTVGPQSQNLLLAIHRYTVADTPVLIAVAETLDALQPQIRRAQLWSAVMAGILIAIFVWLQYRWMLRNLAPLHTLKQQLNALQQGQIQKLEPGDSLAELEPLIREINQLVLALDERILRSRNAMGNLAHGLKTPMAVIAQLCDQSDEAASVRIEKIRQQLTLIQERVEGELKRARIAGAQGRRGQIVLRDEVVDLVMTLTRIYENKHLQTDIDIPPDVRIACDRQDFLELMGNLLDNACKWSYQRFRVHTELNGGLRITVEDDGPGCSPEKISQLTQRGVRMDEQAPGHGLGLAIVSDIVAQYHGTLNFDESTLGGLRVQVALKL